MEKRERSPCSGTPRCRGCSSHPHGGQHVYLCRNGQHYRLGMAGCELDNSGVTVPVMYPSAPAASYEMDTYSRDNSEEDEPVQKVAECPINKMNEEEKMDLLKRSILKAQSYTPLFTKSVIGCQSIRWQRTRTSSSTAIMHTLYNVSA